MNSNNRLFTNKFIQNLDSSDISSSQKEQFRRYHEERIKEQTKKQFLEISKIPPKVSNKGKDIVASTDVYSNLTKFAANTGNMSNEVFPGANSNSQFSSRQVLKFEKKTIVSLDTRNRDPIKYPEQNDFKAFLGKTFFNVKSIELVSTEFPNTDQVIKDTPLELQNNLITWQNEEDTAYNIYSNLAMFTTEPNFVDIFLAGHGYPIGSTVIGRLFNNSDINLLDGQRELTVINDGTFRFPYQGGVTGNGTTDLDLGIPTYTVSIKPGNYTASTLAEQMSIQMGLVRRGKGSGIPEEDRDFHNFTVSVNLDTDVITIDSVVATQLAIDSISTEFNSTTITVNQTAHGFKTGDRVKMIGIKTFAGISASVLNGDYFVTVSSSNVFSYEVITKANETLQGGGNTILSCRDAPFRLLFDTENTLIQFNTGFPDEDSAEPIGADNPITTKALDISAVDIISADKVRFTTVAPHGLQAVQIKNISTITKSIPSDEFSEPVINTSTSHGIFIPTRITVRGSNSTPSIDGTYIGTPIGDTAILVTTLLITAGGTTGQVVYGDDKIRIFGLKTVPNILINPVFFVENVPTNNQFDITFRATQIDTESISSSVIGTSHIFVNHPNHGFNQLSTITQLPNNFANLTTFVPHNLIGSRIENVPITSDPAEVNIFTIELPRHGLSTSDIITIEDVAPPYSGLNSSSIVVDIVDEDTLRIVKSLGYPLNLSIPGGGTIITGDSVTLANTNSVPSIDGTYRIDNRRIIKSIKTPNFIEITTALPNSFASGNSITISGSNSIPSIDGTYTITSIITPGSVFEIFIEFTVTASATTGSINNNTTLETGNIGSNTTSNVMFVNIETYTSVNWEVGDFVTISETGGDFSTQNLNGTYSIENILSSTIFQINFLDTLDEALLDIGVAVNINKMEIDLKTVTLVTQGTFPAGIIGRNLDVLHYRIVGENPGADNIAGIKLNGLNGKERSIARLIDQDNYMIRAVEEYAYKTITAGGSNVHVSSYLHGLRAIQVNTEDGTTTGVLFRAISLEGENYVFLVCDSEGVELNTVYNSGNISNAFAKIILSESPGNLMFNSYISEPKMFDNPIAKIDTMRFRVITPGGYPFNFNGINYSFTLRITELVNQLDDSFVSSRTGTNEFQNLITKGQLNTARGLGDETGKNTSLTNTSGPGFAIRSSAGRGNTSAF